MPCRAQMETRARENRAMEVEFISVDKAYKPRTTSWGVFPRPQNISAAYGGGRNIEPGTPLESEEASAARLAKVRAAMGQFRKDQGMDISAADASAVAATLEQGEAAFAGGRLERAAAAFRSAAALAPLMSEPGGTARLRLAVCLDSLGQQDEAKELYASLGRHPNADVKKQASRLLWGMTEASAFLKADTFDYSAAAGIKEKYAAYLESQVNVWDLYREADAEETAALNRVAIAAAAALVALPVGLLAALRTAAEAHRVTIAG